MEGHLLHGSLDTAHAAGEGGLLHQWGEYPGNVGRGYLISDGTSIWLQRGLKICLLPHLLMIHAAKS